MKKHKAISGGPSRLRRKTGGRFQQQAPAPSSAEELQRLHHELQVHQVELERQNEELRQAKGDAEEALQRFTDLYEFAPVGCLTLDRKGTILAVNLVGADLLGEERSRLVGWSFKSFVVNQQQNLDLLLDRVSSGRGKHSCEITLRSAQKKEIYIRLEAQASRSGAECQVALIDITGLHQEELFHLQLECVEGLAVYMLDTRGIITTWNAGAERLEGFRAEEIIGKHFSCLYSEQDRQAVKPERELAKAAAEGRFSGECWRIRKDGSGFWADVVLTPLRDHDGNLWGFSKVTRDITGRKKTEQALSFSESRYRALFEENPTMILTLDTEWRIVSANPTVIAQLGYAKDELVGQTVLKLFHEQDHAAVIRQFQQCLSSPEEVHRWLFRKIRKEGGLLWVEETARATFGISGTPNVLVVCQDVTERKRIEEERERLLMQLEAVLDNVNEAVVITDLDANVLSMNRAALLMYGYEGGDVNIRRPLSQYQDTFEFSDVEGHPVPFEAWPLIRALRGESFVGRELRVLRKDTGKSWIGSYNGSQVVSKSGGTVLAVITVRDITEAKRVEEALRESEARFHAIFNLAAVGIAQVSLTGHWLLMNQKLADIVGYDFRELETMTLQQISHPDDIEPHLTHIRSLLAGEVTAYAMEKRYIRKDGMVVWVNLNVTLVRDQGGEPQYFIAIVEDINERKKAEEEIMGLNRSLAERALQLEAANQELESFNFTVAHDLRQPLNVISSYCQLIDKICGDQLDDECRGYVQGVNNTTLGMDRLIGTLLDFSRVARMELKREDFDLSSMTREVAAELKLTDLARQVEFKIQDGIMANGDPGVVRVVLQNLLGNAWKYTAIREKATIELGMTKIGGEDVYFVRDNGIGFDMKDATPLFAPFQRLQEAVKQKGFGIGLATVERIIRRHGGRVCAEGEQGKGACFYFTLPAGGQTT